jgi:hypothetical protein
LGSSVASDGLPWISSPPDLSVSPFLRMASSWAPRATTEISADFVLEMRAAMWPPIAPAPKTHTFML